MSAIEPAGQFRTWSRDGTLVVALLGPIAVGKSYLARRLGPLLGVPIVHNDQIRRARWPNPRYDHAEDDIVYEQARREIDALLADGHETVVYDAMNLEDDRRAQLELGDGRVVWVLVWAAPEVLRARLAQRDIDIPLNDYGYGSNWDFLTEQLAEADPFPSPLLVVTSDASDAELIAAIGPYLDRDVSR
jgi:predicted kinase